MEKEEFQFLSENLSSKELNNIIKSFSKQLSSRNESNKKTTRKRKIRIGNN